MNIRSISWWQPKPNHQGQIRAQVRLLPAPNSIMSTACLFTHELSIHDVHPLIEFCCDQFQTDRKCKICQQVDALKATEELASIKLAYALEPSVFYISNIVVLDDSADGSNVDQVFLYACDWRIWHRLEFGHYSAYDLDRGRNLVIHADFVDGAWNWSGSQFQAYSALYSGNRARVNKVVQQCWSLERSEWPQFYDEHSLAKLLTMQMLAQA